MLERVRVGVVVGAAVVAAVGCQPSGERGHCDVSSDCPGRAQECDVMTHECFVPPLEADSTKDDAPASFVGEVVPFFRGEICIPDEVRSGDPLPIVMRPCFHPCLQATDRQFRHSFECVGSSCLGFAMTWVVADATACPSDAFARFDRSMCTGEEVQLVIDTAEGPDGEIVGSMLLEAPYLTNEDMAAVAANPGVQEQRISQYPQDGGRIVGERTIWILPASPRAPSLEDCSAGNGCTCYDVGF
jgi:hypothetical protein